MSKGMDFGAMTLPYAENAGERAVEIPIANLFLGARWTRTLLEIGAVTPYWYDPQAHMLRLEEWPPESPATVPWRVIDPHDRYPEAVRQDATRIESFFGKAVLTISTLEHIGMGHYGHDACVPDDAVKLLGNIVRTAAAYLITWPLGISPRLDAAGEAMASRVPHAIIKQVAPHRYVTLAADEWSLKYNEPYPYANGVVIMSNGLGPGAPLR